MSQEKIAILHAGFHKTGSSSIQHTLGNNRDLLAKHGYCYPDILVEGVQFYNCSVPLFGYYTSDPEKFDHYRYHNDLEPDIANRAIGRLFEKEIWKKDKLVFSDEFIASLEKSELERLRDDFKSKGYSLKVICYVREPFAKIVSVTQQWTRRKTVEKALTGKRLSSEPKRIQKIIDVFQEGAEFYSFEKACKHPAGPAGLFFELLGINLPEENAVRINESMSNQSVRLLTYINGIAPGLPLNRSPQCLRKRHDVRLLSKIEGDKFKLTHSEVEKIRPLIEEARKNIAEILGESFLPPANFFYSNDLGWGEQQLRYVLGICDSLDLHVLIRVYDFIQSLDFKSEAEQSIIADIARKIRKRLDIELLLRGRLSDPRALAKKYRVMGVAKRLKSFLNSRFKFGPVTNR